MNKAIKILLCVLASGALCAVAGLEEKEKTEPRATTAPVVIERSHVDPETGDLIAFWKIGRGEGAPKGERVPVLVKHPYPLVTHQYAMFIQWPNEEWHPDSADKRVFIFYDDVAKKSYQTRDFDAFLKVVAKQPRDITLYLLDTCTVSRDYMPEKQWSQLAKVLADGNRTLAEAEPNHLLKQLVCYCSFEWDFVLPGDVEEKNKTNKAQGETP